MTDSSDPAQPPALPEASRIRRAAADLTAARASASGGSSGRRHSRRWAQEGVPPLAEAYRRMYPADFRDAVEASATGDPAAVDRVLTFLEVDPWCDGSGYVKERILHVLKRAPLEGRQEARLRRVVLAAVDGGDRREFRAYSRLAPRVADEGFRADLIARLRAARSGVGRRALWVLEAIHEPLGAVDRQAVLQMLEAEAASAGQFPMVLSWVWLLARRYGDSSWVTRLAHRAAAGGPGANGALCLLPVFAALLSDADRAVLGDRLLAMIAEGAITAEHDTPNLLRDTALLAETALLADTPALRERLLAAFAAASDPDVERRAAFAIEAIRAGGRGGWPEVDPMPWPSV